MNDDLRARVTAIFERIEGGSSADMWSMIDDAIENGEIDREDWLANEYEICALFDAYWFTCEGCAWTLPLSNQDADYGNWHCRDCVSEGNY